MVKKTTVALTDDLDGRKAERTVRFGLDGASYEIDLSKKNALTLEKALAPYVAAGRAVRATHSRGRRPSARRASNDVGAIREWARQNGHHVSDRGRISATVLEAYRAQH